MDNFTHTLAGILVAEVALAVGARRGLDAGSLRGAAYGTSILANNFPDLDFAYAAFGDGKLGYLLHHRGHTHTLALALPQALLTLGVMALWWRWRRRVHEPGEWALLGLLALLGPVVHVTMDWSNNYGVHAWWPMSNGWSYGDTLFIVEPLLWVTLAPLLSSFVASRLGRGLLGALALAAVVLSWATGMVPAPAAGVVTALAVAFGLLGWKGSARARLAAALASPVVIVAGFRLASATAERRVAEWLAREMPAVRTHDLVLTPLPGNPLCFSVLAVQTAGDRYLVRRGRLSNAPGLVPVARCPDARMGNPTAPLVRLESAPSDALIWDGVFSMPRAELLGVRRESCRADAFLRWSRAPFLAEHEGRRVLGDLRYDREPGLGFAEIELDGEAGCPAWVPGWRPPRALLLD